jgi:hypothetical protein
MVSSLGPVNQLVSVITSQLSKAGAARQAGPGRRASAGARPGAAGRDLASLIALRVGEIDADDPNRGRKAFRVFLEAVLLSQLGEQLINDPQFHQLVGDVQGALEADPTTRAMVDSAIAALVAPSSKR